MRSLFWWRFNFSVLGWAAVLLAAMAEGSHGFAQSEINEAAGSGDLGRVTELLRQDPHQVSSPDASNKTPLHWAVIGDHKTVAEVLMAFYADVNARDDDGETPLFLAAQMGKVDMVEVLLTNIHTDPDLGNLRGDTPLHEAVRNDDKDVAELLLAHHLDANPKPNEPHDDQTHLDAPVQPESSETVQEVLEGNAYADNKDDSGTTAVDVAAAEGDEDLAEVMVSRDADVNVKNNDGETPLGLAVQMEVESGDFGPAQRRDVVELLLAKGAWIDSIDNGGFTPLQRAIAADDKDLVELLLARRPNFKLDTQSGHGRTPLFVAELYNRLDMMELLLAKGANADIRDEEGRTPLSDAASRGRLQAVEVLLAHHADVNVRDKYGMTPLLAAKNGAEGMGGRHGSDKDAAGPRGRCECQRRFRYHGIGRSHV
jgi:ankyrin repeat protein